MSRKLEKLQFVIGLIDKISNPITRIQARLHALGLEQMALFRNKFHQYGQSAAQAASKVGLITAAIVAATAATSALTAAMLPIAGMAATGVGAAIGTANAAGIAQEATQFQQQTGMATDQLLMYRQAGRFVGVDAGMGQLGDTSKVFTAVHTQLAKPDEAFAKTLQRIKLPLKEIKGMQPEQFLNRVVVQMDKLGFSEQKKSRVLDELVSDASQLLPLLGANNQLMQRFQRQSQATGAILTPAQIALMRNASLEWALMKTSVEGYGNSLADIGGNFMKLFGPDINQWLADNKTQFNDWTQGQINEVKRLHGVFKKGGLQAVYADLFPNLSSFTGRAGSFINGFNRSFADPFMSTVRSTWTSVEAVLGSAAGGAEGMGAAFGAASLPIFTQTIEIIGSTLIWLESNWSIVKKIFAWSPLGLIIENWGGIIDVLQPINQWITQLAQSMGMVAPGFNASGNAGGTLFGVLTAIAGVLLLNKLAFGAVYQIVRLYSFAIAMLKGLTMLATAATWAWNAALMIVKVSMIALRTVALVGFLFTIVSALGIAAIAAGAMSAATWLLNGALAVLTSPITLIIAAVAALAAIAYYLYTHWSQVKAYLGDTAWGQALLGVINSVIHPLDALNAAVAWLSGLWASTKASLAETTWGQFILGAINGLISPFETFKTSINAAKLVWDSIKNSLSDTSWGQAIISTIDRILGFIGKFKEGWASLKSAASENISGAWGRMKAAVGFGDEPTSAGGRAVGGLIRAGVPYRINERVPEVMIQGSKTWVLNDQPARIMPLAPLNAANNNMASVTRLTDRLANHRVAPSTSNNNMASVTRLTDRLANHRVTHSTSNNNMATVTQLTDRLANNRVTHSTSNNNLASVTRLTDRLTHTRMTNHTVNDPTENISARVNESQAPLREIVQGRSPTQEGGLRNLINNSLSNRERLLMQSSGGKRIQIGTVHLHINGEVDAERLIHELEMAS